MRLTFGLILFVFFSCSQGNDEPLVLEITDLELSELVELPDQTQRHNAFTDAIIFDDQFYICFRSSDKHVFGTDGVIQIYRLEEGWKKFKTISVDGIDLRDPKFTIHNNVLHLDIHGSLYDGRSLLGYKDYLLTFDGVSWSDISLVKVGEEEPFNEAWPWKIRWHNDTAFTIGYKDPIFDTYFSLDGHNYTKANAVFDGINDAPLSEAAIRIRDQKFYAIVRNGAGPTHILKSENPTKEWKKVGEVPITNFGGPNFVFFDQSQILLSGRKPLDDGSQELVISKLNIETLDYEELIVLPGEKDLGYPGLIIENNTLYISYYASGENGTRVSFATLEILN